MNNNRECIILCTFFVCITFAFLIFGKCQENTHKQKKEFLIECVRANKPLAECLELSKGFH